MAQPEIQQLCTEILSSLSCLPTEAVLTERMKLAQDVHLACIVALQEFLDRKQSLKLVSFSSKVHDEQGDSRASSQGPK